ncbi:hypothetical protein EDC04DRAFT_2645040 [Pisolithus marmoratus]|nr:hypothetical protein EDC04DRAFT_2645040 [Pisolithus marmoratus]
MALSWTVFALSLDLLTRVLKISHGEHPLLLISRRPPSMTPSLSTEIGLQCWHAPIPSRDRWTSVWIRCSTLQEPKTGRHLRTDW